MQTGNGDGRYCKQHGGRKKCSQIGCDNFAQGRRLCIGHGYKMKCFSVNGCTNQCVQDMCKRHGREIIAIHCSYNGFYRPVHSRGLCMFHVRIEGTMTQFDLDDCILQHVFEFVGCNNREWILNLSYVCNSWKRVAGHHLSKVGLVPMDGGADCKLIMTDFLAYLTRPVFQNVNLIYIPCG